MSQATSSLCHHYVITDISTPLSSLSSLPACLKSFVASRELYHTREAKGQQLKAQLKASGAAAQGAQRRGYT